MINLRLGLFALLFVCNFAYASDLYIKLGTTTSQKQVEQIEGIVASKGYRVYVQEDDSSYRLYVGSFATQLDALRALQSLKGVFPAAVAVKLRPQSFENSAAQSPQSSFAGERAQSQKASSQREERSPFFVQVALGFHNSTSDVSGDINVSKPGASGMSYGFGLGYELSEKIWASLNFDMLGTDSFTMTNIYTTLNYNFWHTESLSAFAGGIVGYSSLSWDSNPLGDGESSGPSSFFAGAQIGLIYPVGEGFSVVSSYALTSYKHNTVLVDEPNDFSGAIEQSITHKIILGLQYNF